MAYKFTHIGILEGRDARSPQGSRIKVELRETKLYWVTSHGIKYHKHNGRGTGTWPLRDLDLDSIKPIE